MDNKPTALWVKDQETPKNLRAPTNLALFKNDSKVEEQIVSSSKLSVEAPEWYPSNHTAYPIAPMPSSTSSVQNRLLKHKTTVSNTQNSDDSPDITRLKQIICTLTNDPGQFDHLLELFLDTMFPYFEDIYFMSQSARILIEQAINSPNFRYTAARLIDSIQEFCPSFRAEIHLNCKKELERNENTKDVLLFIAELYATLQHLNIYGSLLIESFKKLLHKGGNDNVKCICQALKLTGYNLEKCDKHALDEIFQQMQNLKPSLTGSPLILLNSVENLRQSNWGHTGDSYSNSTSDDNDVYYADHANAGFYNSDGHTFSSEESDFLATNLNSTEDYFTTDLSDPDELCDPEPEMDEEIQEAFKEFVKLSK